MSAQLVISDISIRQDKQNRYCLNDLHKASGDNQKHRPKYFLENQQTKGLVDELVNEKPIGGITPIFTKQGLGTFAAKEIVYAYAMWISPSFSLKVIRAYDSLVNKAQPEPPKLTYATKEQRAPLVKAVRRLVKVSTEKGKILTYENAHSIINLKMGVDGIEALTPEQIPQAMVLVGSMLEKVVMEGEFIAKGETTTPVHQKINSQQKQELAGAMQSAFCGWIFNGNRTQHGYNFLRGVFSLKDIDDLPADNLPVAMTLIDELKEKNWKLLLMVNELLEEFVQEYIEAGAPWTPDLKRKWRKRIKKALPDRPDWQAIKELVDSNIT